MCVLISKKKKKKYSYEIFLKTKYDLFFYFVIHLLASISNIIKS